MHLLDEATPHLGEQKVMHSPVNFRLHVLEVMRVALCIPSPLDPRDHPPALGPGVFADHPGSGLSVQ